MKEGIDHEVAANMSARAQARGNRELARKKPWFRREIVEAKVQSLFPNQPGEILRLLDEYDPDPGEGAARLHLDILKLSNGDLEQLCTQIGVAKGDYRDVILAAENPEFVRLPMDSWLAMSEAEKDELRDRDVQQYLDWLQTPGRSFSLACFRPYVNITNIRTVAPPFAAQTPTMRCAAAISGDVICRTQTSTATTSGWAN